MGVHFEIENSLGDCFQKCTKSERWGSFFGGNARKTRQGRSAGEFQNLKLSIESGNGDAVKVLQALLRAYQSAYALHDEFDSEKIQVSPTKQTGYGKLSIVTRWATVYVLSECLFDYARNQTDTIPPKFPTLRLLSAVRHSGFEPQRYDDLERFLTNAVKQDFMEI
ncbi:hypothetical protein EDD53_2078 [Pacificibacter maritimus]|uniref:Uncharacterized protein n=1 Tax=Pacificibacter maritimus TaxID=762213 RepID=A0A3N4U6H9_9RHOB|nr:hypothetical protein EDD53_2078 [Pacificibacter maritimus]